MALLYEQQGHVVTITLNRPEAMNAIDPETHQELIDAWARFRDDPDAWVAILTGAGEKAFSAGADLKKLIPQAFARPGVGRSHNDLGLGGITRGMEIWKPIIGAVNGYALAGGLELVLCCDLRVAAEHASFGLTEVRWAIMPGAGGTQRLPRMVPLAKAMEMILMGETCSAQEAHRIGLVNAVVPATRSSDRGVCAVTFSSLTRSPSTVISRSSGSGGRPPVSSILNSYSPSTGK